MSGWLRKEIIKKREILEKLKFNVNNESCLVAPAVWVFAWGNICNGRRIVWKFERVRVYDLTTLPDYGNY